jgi:hypothetical protein
MSVVYITKFKNLNYTFDHARDYYLPPLSTTFYCKTGMVEFDILTLNDAKASE